MNISSHDNAFKNTEFIEMVINRFEHESNKIEN